MNYALVHPDGLDSAPRMRTVTASEVHLLSEFFLLNSGEDNLHYRASVVVKRV